MSTANPTGYGPSAVNNRLLFDGDEERYQLWECKFVARLHTLKLAETLDCADQTFDTSKNAQIFYELVQLLDDKSLQLIINDAKNDGRKSIEILRNFYVGSSRPRIISLYHEITSLHKSETESVTDYMLRGEKLATSLKSAGQTVSDQLLIAMILKGLDDSYKAFSTVITQRKEDPSFSEFKTSLRSFEESEKVRTSSAAAADDRVMQVKAQRAHQAMRAKCYNCGIRGHFQADCKEPKRNNNNSNNSSRKKWCNLCKNKTHNTDDCRKRSNVNNVKTNDDGNRDYTMKINIDLNSEHICSSKSNVCKILVDTGASSHIITDINKFIRKDDNFEPERHVIELADGSRHRGLVRAKGDATCEILDSDGTKCNVTLNNALCIPSYHQDILSVDSATGQGCGVQFHPNTAFITTSNGTRFDINKEGKLYYLNTIKTCNSQSLLNWHKTLGHCNTRDILKLEEVVDGMKIGSKNSQGVKN